MTVYIIQCGELPFVKIGSSDDPRKRLSTLQGAHYETLHILRTVPGGLPTELQFRDRFRRFHHRREWYRLDAEMLTFEPVPEPEVVRERLPTSPLVIGDDRTWDLRNPEERAEFFGRNRDI